MSSTPQHCAEVDSDRGRDVIRRETVIIAALSQLVVLQMGFIIFLLQNG